MTTVSLGTLAVATAPNGGGALVVSPRWLSRYDLNTHRLLWKTDLGSPFGKALSVSPDERLAAA